MLHIFAKYKHISAPHTIERGNICTLNLKKDKIGVLEFWLFPSVFLDTRLRCVRVKTLGQNAPMNSEKAGLCMQEISEE